MPDIRIIPIAPLVHFPIEQLRDEIATRLRRDVCIDHLPIDEDASFDRSRQQYHSGHLLHSLLTAAPIDDSKVLGITHYDLFVPIFTFVFGQAQMHNRTALFSTFRLGNDFYGLPFSKEVLFSRALKEAMHELGHTFGLAHCFDGPCAMNQSTYVEDIDLKPAAYCLSCAEIVLNDAQKR